MNGLAEAMAEVKGFLDQKKTGQVVLEIRNGSIVACRLTQSVRIATGSQPCEPMEYKTNAR